MYIIPEEKFVNKAKLVDKNELLSVNGFMMASSKKKFKIDDSSIDNIKVVNKRLANPLAAKKVEKKYNKLIVILTDLLIDDDDSGDSYREVLNQIEKFRLEVKNKYREYLKRNELEKMSHQLKMLQKEAMDKLIELQNSYLDYSNSNNRSR